MIQVQYDTGQLQIATVLGVGLASTSGTLPGTRVQIGTYSTCVIGLAYHRMGTYVEVQGTSYSILGP